MSKEILHKNLFNSAYVCAFMYVHDEIIYQNTVHYSKYILAAYYNSTLSESGRPNRQKHCRT